MTLCTVRGPIRHSVREGVRAREGEGTEGREGKGREVVGGEVGGCAASKSVAGPLAAGRCGGYVLRQQRSIADSPRHRWRARVRSGYRGGGLYTKMGKAASRDGEQSSALEQKRAVAQGRRPRGVRDVCCVRTTGAQSDKSRRAWLRMFQERGRTALPNDKADHRKPPPAALLLPPAQKEGRTTEWRGNRLTSLTSGKRVVRSQITGQA